MSAAYPDASLVPLAFPALVPLLMATALPGWRQRFGVGLAFGTAYCALTFHWIHHTLVSMTGLPSVAAALVTALFALASGLHHAGFAVLGGLVRRGSGAGWPWALAACWVTLEAAFPHLFPFHIANIFYALPVAVQVADLTGPYGTGFAVVCVVGASMQAVSRRTLRPLALPALLWVAVLVYGVARMSAIDGTAPERVWRVGMVQPNLTTDDKQRKGDERVANYRRAVSGTRALDGLPLDLIVWPEGAFPFYIRPTPLAGGDDDRTWGRVLAEDLEAVVRARGVPFVVGSLRRPEPGARSRNAALHYGPDGAVRAVYDKRVLVPLGERIPLADTFPALTELGGGLTHMDPGEDGVLFDIGGVTVQPSICYEAVFARFTRLASLGPPRADVLLNLTNDVWFGPRSAPELHLMVQVMRAIELRLPLVRSTNSGVSAFVDAAGRIQARTAVGEATTLTDTVLIRDLASPYREAGDVFLYAAAFAAAVAGWRGRKVKGQSRSESPGVGPTGEPPNRST
jgi:apolipoprotein N-acyltransferase